jgi:hypothetical protein
MLENDLRTLFEQQAAADQPPAEVSVASILRRASTARRRQLAAGFASPMLAVGAVVGIALGGLLPGGAPAHPVGHRPATTTPAPAPPGTAPSVFSPFQPYAAFGWLPAHLSTHVQDYLFLTEVVLLASSPALQFHAELDVQAAGKCHIGAGRLICKYGMQYGLPVNKIGRPVGLVDGAEAYWTPARGSGMFGTYSVLDWEYAPGAWATLVGPNLTTALQVARRVVFGPAAARPLRFAVQLQHVPAAWHVFCVVADWQRGVEYASNFVVTAQKPDANPGCGYAQRAPTIDEGVGSERACASLMGTKAAPHVINGFHVLTEKYLSWNTLCANNAGGVFVWIEVNVSDPTITVVNLFAHHLKLFGPNPAKWAAAPIG